MITERSYADGVRDAAEILFRRGRAMLDTTRQMDSVEMWTGPTAKTREYNDLGQEIIDTLLPKPKETKP